MTPQRYPRLLILAALLGIPAAGAAALITAAMHQLEQLAWVRLPEALGYTEPPAWLVVLLPALAGGIVAASLRLPGHGGHPARDGLSVEPVLPKHLPSILIASAASISLGPVVGPEAPLIALGLAFGLVAGQLVKQEQQVLQVLAFAGAFATLSTAFGGPLPSALLLFEIVATSGRFPSAMLGRLLLPGFVAAGTGALVFTGIGDWAGVQAAALHLPELPAYPTVLLTDLLWLAPLAVAAAATTVGAGRLAEVGVARIEGRVSADWVLVCGGLLIGALAVLFRALADRPVHEVLFSGAGALGEIVGETAALVLLVLLVAKLLAFVITLIAGFRGGLIFPAVTIAVTLGALASAVLPGLHLTPAIVAAIAASASAQLRAPFFGALMAALLAGQAITETMPIAVIAAAIGWLVAMRLAPPAPEGPGATA